MTNKIKLIAIAFFAVPAMMLVFSNAASVRGVAATPADDPAATYKTKCAACHGPKAEKFYDAAAPVDEQVTAILKGKKGEKPPYMPAFETKGITEDDAKALAAYMKSLKAPAN